MFTSLKQVLEIPGMNSKAAECLGLSGAIGSLEDLNELEAAEYAKETLSYIRESSKREEQCKKTQEKFSLALQKYSDKVEDIKRKNEEKKEKHLAKMQAYETKLSRWQARANKNPDIDLNTRPSPPVLELKEIPPPPQWEDIAPPEIQEPAKPRITLSLRERLRLQRELLNVYLSGHPLNEVKIPSTVKTVAQLKESDDLCNVNLIGILSSFKVTQTRSKKLIARLFIEDKTGGIEVVAFSSLWEKISNKIQVGNIYTISGKLNITRSGSDSDGEEEGSEVRYVSVVGTKVEPVMVGSDTEWDMNYPLFRGTMRILPGPAQKSREFARSILSKYTKRK